MKRMRKDFWKRCFCVASCFAFLLVFPAFADWEKGADQNWYYYDEDGGKLTGTVMPDGYTVDDSGKWDPSVPRKTAGGGLSQPRFTPNDTCNNYAGKRSLPIYKVQTDKKQVALTFDSDWENKETGKSMT